MTEHGEQDKAELRLTDEQLAELKRRLADPNPKFLALEEVRERFARRRAWQAKGLPATSTVLSVVCAAADLGIRKIALVNKWTEEMNRSLAAFFAREGVAVAGAATKSLHPHDFHQIPAGEHMRLAYDLGRQAFLDHADCDAVYIGGGSWIAEPVAARLEAEFGRPVLCNQAAVIRHTLKLLGAWTPIEGHSRLLAAP